MVPVGQVDPNEFQKAIEKVGILIPTRQELMNLFNHYDADKSGQLDYREFSDILFGRKQSGSSQAPSAASAQSLMDKVRNKLKQRGAKGIIGLGRHFRIVDDNGSGTLDK